MPFELVERAGSPGELLAEASPPGGRQVVVSWPTSGAVVLGSTQPASDYDSGRCERRRLDLVRRRSGGGAVLVRPGDQLWVDFYLPASDPLLCADVSRSFLWVGELWAAALRAVPGILGPVEIAERAGSPSAEWARRLCFCGLVKGEVTLSGKKVVGLCQRRDRAGAWFHTMALTALDVGFLAGVVSGGEAARRAAGLALAEAATALPGTAAATSGGSGSTFRGGSARGGPRSATMASSPAPISAATLWEALAAALTELDQASD